MHPKTSIALSQAVEGSFPETTHPHHETGSLWMVKMSELLGSTSSPRVGSDMGVLCEARGERKPPKWIKMVILVMFYLCGFRHFSPLLGEMIQFD